MDLSLKLQSFEGPMDLLLHLIDKNKVDICDIPIAIITDQYFAYIEEMKDSRLDDMSEFLVMAATLLDIKVRMLLPAQKDEEGEEIDPRDELVQKLLEYKMYKYMSFELREREDDASKSLYRAEHIPREVKAYREPVDLNTLLGDVTLQKLAAVFRDVCRRQDQRTDPIRSSFGQIEKEPVDTKKVLGHVTKRIWSNKKCTFRSLLLEGEGRMYTVVTFLTILELMKMGRVGVEQDDIFGEIMITAKDESEWEKNEQGEIMDLAMDFA